MASGHTGGQLTARRRLFAVQTNAQTRSRCADYRRQRHLQRVDGGERHSSSRTSIYAYDGDNLIRSTRRPSSGRAVGIPEVSGLFQAE
jgi:hypothetical protein